MVGPLAWPLGPQGSEDTVTEQMAVIRAGWGRAYLGLTTQHPALCAEACLCCSCSWGREGQ